ncbi:MAG TPA: UDP-glucose/GDP-mannose dehydrogenase family protein [Planctomycetota bacterium]|nr:UDP-glucose/GDP-mannose dehydrogenase family protein [Planctomycetota bacterium]
MKIAVIGSGYVGLVVGTCFADSGNRVACVDVNADKIARLQRGEVPIYEPGLEELLQRNVAERRMSFSTDIVGAIKAAQVVFIAVGTPQDEDGSADLSHVLSVADSIGANMNGYKVVVLKSTVPVGTNRKVRERIAAKAGQPFDVVSNPEFLKEGAAIDDFTKPDRVVVGCDSERARKVMEELYGPFLRTGKPLLIMDPPSAEMTKYAANAMLATRISFMNEMARICEAVGADVNHVRKGIGTDARIGFPFLFAGVGYGGSCFPKDVRALVSTAKEHGYAPHIVPAVERVNEEQKQLLFAKVKKHYGDLRGRRFAVWGLAFKPKTDDMREAPSLVLIEALLGAGATVTAFDPEAIRETQRILGDRITYADSALAACEGADGLILVTEWSEFRHLDLDEVKARLAQHVVFDGRNIWDGERVRAQGFTYYGIGVR